jgi:hypothetical protein
MWFEPGRRTRRLGATKKGRPVYCPGDFCLIACFLNRWRVIQRPRRVTSIWEAFPSSEAVCEDR